MMNRYGILFSLIVLGILTLGCIDLDGGEEDGEGFQLVWDEYTENGSFDFIARERSRTVTDSYQIYLDHGNITQIVFTYSFEDGDPGTEVDYLTWISITNVNEGGDADEYILKYDEQEGGSMPYSGEFKMNASENAYLSHAFLIVVTVELYPGEDEWPGPLIWRGVSDTGFTYSFKMEYEYAVWPEVDQ